MTTTCPEIKHHSDFRYDEVIEWAEIHRKAKIQWSDGTFINGNSEISLRPEMASWILTWQYGFITLAPDKQGTRMKISREIAAMFIYLYEKGVETSLAIDLAFYHEEKHRTPTE